MYDVDQLVDYTLKTSGIKQKLIWEEVKCSVAAVVTAAVKNFKVIPGVNVVAMLAEAPIEAWQKKLENKKDTKKAKWRENLEKIIKEKLTEQYVSRSSEELKSSNPQSLIRNLDEISQSVITAIYQRARNTSNKISIGISTTLAVLTAIKDPWIIPISVAVTTGCVWQQARINKKQLPINVEARSNHISKRGKNEHQHSQIIECSQRYASVNGFEDAMLNKLNILADEKIKANNFKQDVTQKNIDNNTMAQTLWKSMSMVVPLVSSYIKGGMTAMLHGGVISAASSVTIMSMAVPAINNYINSKLEEKTAKNVCASLLKKIKSKDLSMDRGNTKVSQKDNIILISKGLTYQHRDFSKDNAPFSGQNVFQCDKDVIIGNGITILGGASGAGKTTLTSLFRRGALATTGSLQMGHFGEDGEFVGVDYANIENIVDNVGVAFQSSPNADGMTVGEYIMLENPKASEEKVEEIKKLLGIGKGENSGLIDEKASVSQRLSGGQQKRIELARTLIKDSPIMILDEPTSGVDETMAGNIVEYIKELGKNKTIIYITHDAEEIKNIGAYQAIDLDKKHSEDGQTNIVKQIDFSDSEEMDSYIEFFKNRNEIKTDNETLVKDDFVNASEKIRSLMDRKKEIYGVANYIKAPYKPQVRSFDKEKILPLYYRRNKQNPL